MSELHRPTLRDADRRTLELAGRDDITDVILQGIASNGSGIIHAMCLKRNPLDTRVRRFDITKTTNGLPAIRTLARSEGGVASSFFSMVSDTVMRTDASTHGVSHIMSTGTHVMAIAKRILKPGSISPLENLGHLSAPENGVTQLIGAAHLLTVQHYKRPDSHNDSMHMLADRQHVPGPYLPKGLIDIRVPTMKSYTAYFDEAGEPGVAHAIFNTINNADGDYVNQPALVSLGRDPNASLEDVADYLGTVFNPDAIAVRLIDRENPAQIDQYVWNAPELPSPSAQNR